MIEDTRAKFEKWIIGEAKNHGYKYMEFIIKREGDGYATTWVDSAWMGWKAALMESVKCD